MSAFVLKSYQKESPKANAPYTEACLTTQNIQDILLYPLDNFRNARTIPECLHYLENKTISKVVLVVLDSPKDNMQPYAEKFKFLIQNCSFALPYRKSNTQYNNFMIELNSYNVRYSKNPTKDGTYSRLTLLMKRGDMFYCGYPTDNPTYTPLLDIYAPVKVTSPMFAIDIERVETTKGSELARISIVNHDSNVIYDEYVKPSGDIVDYLTPYSGITQEKLKNVTKTLSHVQNEIKKILPPDAILCGHSLNMELDALKVWHPYCIDTSVIYKLSVEESKSKLKDLASTILKRNIQTGDEGHDSVEDCQAVMDLVQMKLKMSYAFCKAGFPTPPPNCAHNFLELLDQLQNLGHHKYLCYKKEGIYYYNFSTFIKGKYRDLKCIHQPYLGPKYHIVKFQTSDKEDYCSSVNDQMEAFYNTCPKNTLFLVMFPGDSTNEGLFYGTLKS